MSHPTMRAGHGGPRGQGGSPARAVWREGVDIQLLRSFVVTAEELHFGRAAQRLHVAQPTLSRQIGRLERDLAVELFERGPRGVGLTAAGRRLLERGRPLLDDLDEVVTEVTRLGGARDVVRMGCPPYARYLRAMSGLEARLEEHRPPVELELTYGLSGELSQRLAREELDASILLLTSDAPDLAVVELLEPRLHVLLPVAHPLAQDDAVALDDLRGDTLLFWPRETNPELYDAVLALFPAGAFAQIVQLAASWDVIMSAVASGDGVSVAMPELWQPEMAGVVSRPIAGDPRPGRVVAAARRGESRPYVLAVLTELAAGQARIAPPS